MLLKLQTSYKTTAGLHDQNSLLIEINDSFIISSESTQFIYLDDDKLLDVNK